MVAAFAIYGRDFAAASGYYLYRDGSIGSTDNTLSAIDSSKLTIENPKTKISLSKEGNRELLSPQHLK